MFILLTFVVLCLSLIQHYYFIKNNCLQLYLYIIFVLVLVNLQPHVVCSVGAYNDALTRVLQHGNWIFSHTFDFRRYIYHR